MIYILVIVVFISFILLIVEYAFKQSILAKRKDEKKAIEVLKRRGLYDSDLEEVLNYKGVEEIELESNDYIPIKGYLYNFNKDSKKFIVLLHGYSANHYIQMPFVKMFKDRGYNVLMIDNRSHGKSGGEFASYGKFESEDLDLFINMLLNRFGDDIWIGLHGQSMGASTAIIYANKYGKVNFVISDCGYSDGKGIIKYQLNEKSKLPMFPFYNLLNNKVIRRCKFSFDEVSPIKYIKENITPIMFVHGTSDTTVPYKMSEDMYKVRKNEKDKLLLVEDAEHMMCYAKNKEGYLKTLDEFLSSV